VLLLFDLIINVRLSVIPVL